MHPRLKSGKQFLFEVKLNWLEDYKGILHANDVEGTIHVGAAKSLGGKGKNWSPEHLFISSLSSCYMSTLLSFADKMGFHLSHFECNAIGQIELVNGKYKFTYINLYPKIFINDNTLREKAIEAAKKTQENCLIMNSMEAAIIYHTEIFTEKYTVTPVNEI